MVGVGLVLVCRPESTWFKRKHRCLLIFRVVGLNYLDFTRGSPAWPFILLYVFLRGRWEWLGRSVFIQTDLSFISYVQRQRVLQSWRNLDRYICWLYGTILLKTTQSALLEYLRALTFRNEQFRPHWFRSSGFCCSNMNIICQWFKSHRSRPPPFFYCISTPHNIQALS